MATLTKEVFRTLSEVQQPFCVSVYMPTHRGGEEVLQQTDAKLMKQLWKQVRERLENEGVQEAAARKLAQPLEKMIQDSGFWRHQSEGLAVFLEKNGYLFYPLPLKFEPFFFIGNHFFLKPLLPLFNGNGIFFILALGLEGAALYLGNRYRIQALDIRALIPERLEEVVGYDYEQKTVQFRSAAQGRGAGAFHGHGEGKDDRKTEILQYFREIDRGIGKILRKEHAPLILACPDYQAAMFRSVSTYAHIFPKHIPGNHFLTDTQTLHTRAWDLLAAEFDAPKQQHLDLFMQEHSTSRTSTDITEIVPAAIFGKVEALFLRKGAEIWGKYIPANDSVVIDPQQTFSNVSLTELAAKHTFLQGGAVYLQDMAEMPFEEPAACALFRY